MAVARDDEQKHCKEADAVFTSSSDICDQLLHRYSKSTAAHHRHLCAAAVAIRYILQSDSLPLSPPAYFAAAMSAVSSPALDFNSFPHLLSFLSIAVSMSPSSSISSSNAADAILVLLNRSRKCDGGVLASVLAERALIRCLGFLLGFCNLEDWSSIQPGFETLVSYSVDRRPKIRKNAQIFLEKMFKLFRNDDVIGEASRLVLYLLENHIVLALEINGPNTSDGSNLGSVAVFHTLNLLRLTVPYLSPNVRRQVFTEVSSLVNSEFSVTTMHIFNVMESCFANSISGDISKEAEHIVMSLVPYISVGRNPEYTVVSAVTLLKCAFDALCVHGSDTWTMKIPSVFGPLAALLSSNTSIATHTSNILKGLISNSANCKYFTKNESKLCKEQTEWSVEVSAIKSICRIFEDMLTSSEVPSDHMLIVISHLFVTVGAASFSLMHSIVQKLAEVVTSADRDVLSSDHFRGCIGSAVIAMGPKKMFTLLPISFDTEKMTCSNFWLVPIVKEFAVRSSLGYFLEHIVPLAECIIKASKQAKNSSSKKYLRTYSDDLLGLLPVFCRNPSDLSENATILTKYFVSLLRKSALRETIAISIQELVRCSTNILKPCVVNGPSNSDYAILRDTNSEDVHLYSKKVARKNVRILASISKALLHSLSKLLFKLPSEKHQNVKEAIRCLASISDPEITRGLLQKYLKRMEIFENSTTDDVENDNDSLEKKKYKLGFVIMRLASCIVVEGADRGLVEMIYNLVLSTLKVSDENIRLQACNTLVQILEVHSWFCSSRYDELVDLVLSLKPGTDIPHVKSRFSALYRLLIHGIEATSDEDNLKTFLVLNEVLLALENRNKDVRKTAYDLLVRICSLSACPPSPAAQLLQTKLITMIMGYLSGTTSQIKRGAVSALSVMLFRNSSLCVLVPDLVPSVSLLLESKSMDVVKVVLGFMKVLVLALEGKELLPFLPQVVPSVLLWSSFSRLHLKSKVSVIMEILLRKCGTSAVKSITPSRYIDFLHTVLETRQKRGCSTNSAAKSGGLDIRASEESKGKGIRKNTCSSVRKRGVGSNKGVPRPGLKNREWHKGQSRMSGTRGVVPGSNRGSGYSGKKRKMDQQNSGGVKKARRADSTGDKKLRIS